MYSKVNLLDQNERAMWSAIVFSFRTLLRKSNLEVSDSTDIHVIKRSSVIFYSWGMLVMVSSTQTIQYGQRVLQVPITWAPGHPLCAVFWTLQHMRDFPEQMGSSNLFRLHVKGKTVNMSYSRLLDYVKLLLRKSGLESEGVGLHSLRRAGSSFMHSIGLSLEDIRQAGDWASMAALVYLAKPISSRIDMDHRVSAALGTYS